MKPLRLALDIGNTMTRVGIIDCSNYSCVDRSAFPTAGIDQTLPQVITKLKSTYSVDKSISVSTVVARLKNVIPHLIPSSFDISFVSHLNLPITLNYQNPSALGADRIANCLFCYYTYPGQSSIIIDAGTAIKVELFKNGSEFAGGVILPGPLAQLSALQASTAALPAISTIPQTCLLPGTSTEECMTTGVFEGTIGGIKHIIKSYATLCSQPCRIVATGGAWKLFDKKTGLEIEYVQDLTLIGTGLY